MQKIGVHAALMSSPFFRESQEATDVHHARAGGLSFKMKCPVTATTCSVGSGTDTTCHFFVHLRALKYCLTRMTGLGTVQNFGACLNVSGV
jgi:hypothetical protein